MLEKPNSLGMKEKQQKKANNVNVIKRFFFSYIFKNMHDS